MRKVVPLKVGGAFHTPLMASARKPLEAALAQTSFAAGDYPVVGNTDAAAHSDGEAWPARLVDHLVSPVRWRESQLTLAAMGATTLVEIGGPGSLVAMAKRTVPDITSRVVERAAPGRAAMTVDVLAGEQLLVPERVVISPVSGVFRPAPPQVVTAEGEVVYAGQVVGTVETTAGSTPVTSPFTGFFMGLMAHDGERVPRGPTRGLAPHVGGGMRVAGWGLAVPDGVLTNADLEACLDTSDAWIVERTGVRERRVASDDDTTVSLAVAAGAAPSKRRSWCPMTSTP